MGIHGIYKEIGPGRRIALSKLALEKFEDTGRPLRIAIDTSIWLFQIQASKGGTNPALRTFYYRLLRLIALSIHPVFVFDGPNKPPFKRNKRTGPNVASIPEFLAKQLLKQFGYPIHLAPGEAEAECALLQREGIVDAVLSEDVDTLMFGSGITIRNWSPEKAGKTPTHVNVYDAVETKNGPSALDREGMILVALMSGGDYVPEGIPGCGPKTACEAAKAGFGRDLCRIPTSDKRAMAEWRQRLQHELKTNESKLFRRKHGTLKIPDDFPRLDILGYYTHPAISSQAGLDKLRRLINWDQGLDFPGLRDFTHDAFDWVKLEGAKHFIRSLAPSLLVRQLRIRSKELDRIPTDNVQAIQENEALLIKGIHGKRQHPVTDNCVELRVSFTPIELVTIDLTREEPDDVLDEPPPGLQVGEVDLEDEALDIEDDAPKKRGPTKFDPSKPARIWVMESIVKVGVPLKVQDWEAERQNKLKPRRAATVQESVTNASKATKAKRTKTAGDMPQAPMERFAKVTKPGSQLARALAKTQDAPISRPISIEAIDLLSSSPVAQRTTTPAPLPVREKSPSPMIPELPSSVTKRRRRAPMQRSHTLPAKPSNMPGRSRTPPVLDAIDTLDLLSSPIRPLSSQLPAKKTTQTTRVPRGASVTNSPSKTRQTTLDTWRASATPTRPRNAEPPVDTTPVRGPAELQTSHVKLDELDLTLSSPTRPSQAKLQSERCTASRRPAAVSKTRPPLTSISSNASSVSSDSNSTKSASRKNSKTTGSIAHSRRTSPRLRKSKSVSAEPETLSLLSSPPLAAQKPLPVVDSIDLSCLSSPVPQHGLRTEPISANTLPTSPPHTRPAVPCRRSPRNHTSVSPEPSAKTSPPAAWKARGQRKRQIILRKSVAGAWDFADVDSPQKVPDGAATTVLKGKDRKKWRESEVDFLDLS
ncbi:flap structure-specific endonuclease [Phaeosphaeria sp. MPI-PUGE-AT-0046c]|nr:flap structure-specific endonuclease [Phaeosphaeria sp. MPI-PUGE-AT-0046c]